MHTLALRPEEVHPFIAGMRAGSEVLAPTSKYEAARLQRGDMLIVVYSSGKAVFSGFPEGKLAEDVLKFLEGSDMVRVPTIGADEAGKGESVGPIVVSSFLLRDKRERAYARLAGAMDSKQMSPQQLSLAHSRIRRLKHTTRTLLPQDFNVQFSNNLNELLVSLYKSSLTPLLEQLAGGEAIVYIDKFGGKRHDDELRSFVRSICRDAEVVITPRAERYAAVACASVCAKHEYHLWVHSQEEALGVELAKLAKPKIMSMPERSKLFKLAYMK
ncbi:MAG: hypothetical protein N3H30_02640 [Candidatus Micrarchaeota archaeon]|nr:hypothetical protein [Candidatus Micrarchaeota archaeon]